MNRTIFATHITLSKFLQHLTVSVSFGAGAIIVALGIGMIGYHGTEGMSWVDAFVNAAMILSGMGPLSPLYTTAGKIFAGLYALFSGLLFIAIVGIIFAPVIHLFFHKVHMDVLNQKL